MEYLNEINNINKFMIEEKIYSYILYDNLINIQYKNINKNNKKILIEKLFNKIRIIGKKFEKYKFNNNIY